MFEAGQDCQRSVRERNGAGNACLRDRNVGNAPFKVDIAPCQFEDLTSPEAGLNCGKDNRPYVGVPHIR